MIARIALAAASLALLGAAPDPLSVERERMRAANRASRAAAARSAELEQAAARAGNAAQRARARSAALAGRIAVAAADAQAARARAALVARLLAAQRQRLAERREPLARIVAALQSLGRRPAFVAVAQPGSTDDLVHVRAVLSTLVPVMEARTAAARQEIERVARLRRQAGLAANALTDSAQRLEKERLALVRLEASQRLRSRDLDRDAMIESDRAIALGEQARDIVDNLSVIADATETRRTLAALPGPLLRPDAAGLAARPVYRLPVAGEVVTGFGEAADSGVRARGLTLSVAPGAPILSPAAGRIAWTGRFRGYGRIVILDHGQGWTTLVTGLAASVGPVGARVPAGQRIGIAPVSGTRHVTIELRRRGVPVDLAAMLG